MTFSQSRELNAHVRKGEKGSLVVYANTITRTEHDDKTGEDAEREIPYLKGYTVFNVEQIDGLPEIYHAKAAPALIPVARIERAEKFFAARTPPSNTAETAPITRRNWTMSRCRTLWPSRTRKAITPHWRMNWRTGPSTLPVSPATLAANHGAIPVMPPKNWSPNWQARLCAPTSTSTQEPREENAAYIAMAAGSQIRQPRDFHRRRARSTRCGLSQRHGRPKGGRRGRLIPLPVISSTLIDE